MITIRHTLWDARAAIRRVANRIFWSLIVLFHRRTHSSYVYNGCLAWYNQGCREYEISHPYPYPYPQMPIMCRRVYAVSNYKKHSCFLLSTGSIFTVFMTKHKMKEHTQVRFVLCYRVSVQKKNHKTVTDLFQHSVLIRHLSVISVSSILFNSLLQLLLTDRNS